MKRIRTIMTVLVGCCVAAQARPTAPEAEPAREVLQHGGWTIGFAPVDRKLAERLVERLPHFEGRALEAEAQTFGFGPREIEAKSAELAAGFARWCALSGREAEFQREIARLLPHLRAFQTELNRLMAVRTLEIWRADEVRARFRAREELPGLRWEESEQRAKHHMRFHAFVHPPDYVIRWSTSVPPAIPLPSSETSDLAAAVTELTALFDSWMDALRHVHREIDALIVRAGMAAVAGNVIRASCSNDPSDRWIAEGLGRWAWREVSSISVPPKQVERYALFAAQLPVSSIARQRLRLDEWPEDQHDEAAMMARQVFCNIEERHGADAVPRLMSEFWKLPREQRTTAALKSIYRELMHEPLEAQAPWRSLGG